MSKNKLTKFAECKTFSNMIEPEKIEFIETGYKLKSCWNRDFFRNNNPLYLELGCGTGAYSCAMSDFYPDRNFIAVDIKGSRMWNGAKKTNDENKKNIAFLRTKIEFIDSFFAKDEISGIWITFPDPHLRNSERSLRLTSPEFLEKYFLILKKSGFINLKTDSKELFDYTKSVLNKKLIIPEIITDDLYSCENTFDYEVTNIQTVYESRFLTEGKKICYIKFKKNGAYHHSSSSFFILAFSCLTTM